MNAVAEVAAGALADALATVPHADTPTVAQLVSQANGAVAQFNSALAMIAVESARQSAVAANAVARAEARRVAAEKAAAEAEALRELQANDQAAHQARVDEKLAEIKAKRNRK